MDPDEMDSFEEEPPRLRMDRAPRSVQRHVSSARVDLGGGVMGTLIMTDDPNDYESPDGKKPEDEEEEDSLEDLDPAMDDRRPSAMSSPRRESYKPRRPVRRILPERRHTFQTPEDYPAPPARPSHSSYQQQQQMDNSFSRLNSSYGNLDDSFCRGMSSSGVVRQRQQQQHHHHHHMRPRQDIQILGQSNGLPVISRGGQAVQRQGSVNRILSDSSHQSSHFSGDSSSSRRRPSLASSGSSRHFDPTASSRTLGRTANATANSDFLPSLEPPPVPMMDNPADVDPQSVFANDQEKNRRRSVHEVRRDRGQMLDNLNIGASLRNNGIGSPAPITPRAATTTPASGLMEEPHPALVQDEALDSPRTRMEKKKMQRRKMKGVVKSLMATMRISAAVTN
jgi:hypothetical protein